jgi:hypothetical protein
MGTVGMEGDGTPPNVKQRGLDQVPYIYEKREVRPIALLATVALLLSAAGSITAQGDVEVVENGFRGSMREAPTLVQKVIIGMDGPDERLLYRPAGLLFRNTGDVYIPDGGHHSILVFDRDGNYQGRIGQEGHGPGELQRPDSAYFSWEGELVVPDPENGRTNYYSLDGEFLRSKGQGGGDIVLILPGGGQIPASQGLYIKPGPPVFPFVMEGMEDQFRSDPGLIDIVDEKGDLVRSFGERLDNEDMHLRNLVNGVSLDYHPDGIVAAGFHLNNHINIYNTESGTLERVITRRLAFNPKEPSADLEEISSPDGSEVSIMLQPSFDRITYDLTFDARGYLWVITALVNEEESQRREEEGEYDGLMRIEVFDTRGRLLTTIELDQPATQLRFDSEGDLWLLDGQFTLTARRYEVSWPAGGAS